MQGQKHEYLPPSRGFDHYLGIPYSVDMGPSAWNYYHSIDSSSPDPPAFLGAPAHARLRWIAGPPLPLLRNFEVLEQPTDLNKLSQR